MATVRIPDEGRTISGDDNVRDFLAGHGLRYERWPLEDRVDPSAAPDDILAAYAPEIERLKVEGGYVTADVINITPETPNLDALLQKYSKEHTHSEDEVRFILKGQGLFHIHPDNGPVFGITVEAGDLISVPVNTKHWFDLCASKTIRAIRLFQDMTGWTPHYTELATHSRYEPVCWGPAYIGATANSVVNV